MADRSSDYGSDTGNASSMGSGAAAPQISLPKGGAAIRGIGEKFTANPVTGTGSLTVPIATSPGRTGFGPQLSLSYDSGSGNSSFGLGWSLSLPAITRRTDKGLPRYEDADESDIFILSGAEDLVPVLVQDTQGQWVAETIPPRDGYTITPYRPRIEGLFARIERWTRQSDGDTYWRSISKDNITTFYGATNESRIADPNDPSHVFSWLICQSQDDKGNAISYSYAAEDSANIDLSQANERNRSGPTRRSANRYLSRVKYGNTQSLLIASPNPDRAATISTPPWLFEVVFDYGEGYFQAAAPDSEGRIYASATLTPSGTWPVRQDPFSHYRSCFEVRAYRLCRRVLMFHHFENELGTSDCLVRTTEFSYQENPIATVMTGVTQSGYARQPNGAYLQASLPPLEFEYSQAKVQKHVREVDPKSLANLPGSIDGSRFRWLDLDGEGLQCVLAEEGGAWYYKRNLTPLSLALDNRQSEPTARFEFLTEVYQLPRLAEAGAPRHEFMDLVGDGQLDCVVLDRPGAGFYERTSKEGWKSFAPLVSAPNIDPDDPNLRFIDVDGDGFNDILITDHDALTYYPALGRCGFAAPIRLPKPTDDEAGPAIIFADSTNSIFLADMSGDGLSDIVRIRNGNICYWPNIGRGLFGAKVTMDQAPWFDTPDVFDATRIRLADVDGSGVTDIIYLAADGVRIYFNQSGNAWSDPDQVMDFPPVGELAKIQALDLLGNGTACLVWTSSDPADAGRSIRYIDMMGPEKPYLLVRSWNNLGAETRVSYTPSTAFYLADRAAGQPWATRLPFPVQVVERVETYDWVSRNRFVTRYAYHHGYYDGTEREFRGFGMVEQRDTEELGVLTQTGAFPAATNIDAASYVPPTLTKTWFHTGAFPMGARVTRIYDQEYWSETGLTPDQAAAMLLPDSPLPPDLTGDEIREALRSLKGAMLRQEVYALDGTPAQRLPYSVSERNYTVNRLQPFGANRHAVFFTHARESLDLHYERTTYKVGGNTVFDPRQTHGFVLEVDEFGNEKKSVAIGYGRKYAYPDLILSPGDPDLLLTPADYAVQLTTLVTYTESTYTNPILDDDAYRTRLPADIRTYELTGYTPSGSGGRFQSGDFVQETPTGLVLIFDSEIPYEGTPTSGRQRRMIEQVRTLYRKDDLSTALPLGTLDTMALPFVGYKLALTPGLLSLYQRGSENLLPTPASVLKDQAGYVLGDDQVTAGLFPPSDPAAPAQELKTAQSHFFLPRRYRDAFGASTPNINDINDTIVTFDLYDLLLVSVQDAAQNTVTSVNDYRVLQPNLLTDPNGNQSAAAFDALGLVVGTAVMGKAGQLLGDTLTGFSADLTQSQIDSFFSAPKGPAAATLLGNATSRIVYDVGRFARPPSTDAAPLPVYAATIARETHVAALGAGQVSNLQVSFSYSDGFGREIQRKAQAEPGPLTPNGASVNPRWVGSGWIINNNKGKPVRQYEPFFDDTHDFKFGATVGVSPTLFYDPVGRVVATLHPDQSWEKVVFDPWRQDSWDQNDTVLIDPSTDPDVADYFQRIPSTDYLPTWYQQRTSPGADPEAQDAAQKAAIHAKTPTTVQADSLGRAFLSFAYNRFQLGASPPVESHDRTLTTFDIEGNQRSVTDALGRVVMTYDYDMLSTRIHQLSVDAGERWMLNNVLGKPLLGWDSRAHTLKHEYDVLRRPTNLWVQTGAGAEQLAEQALYGENQASDQANNLRGKLYQQFDGAGVVTNSQYDVKGNLLASSRELRTYYQDEVDWSQSPSPALTGEAFAATTTFDALNRPVTMTAPDGSVTNVTYNEASLLAQIAINLRGATASTAFVTGITYNAKGQRELIEFGNGASTAYSYDTNTFRLVTLTTTRPSDNAALQALSYAYDPVGNITHIADSAQQTVFFNNQIVNAGSDYVYDARYRLIQAQGRESIGLASQPQTTSDDNARMGQALPLPSDAQALRNYTETYQYDPVGNFLALTHMTANGNWTRTYAYDEPNVPPTNNRLTSTMVSGTNEVPYTYDPHGNMISMPHLSLMAWDFKDQLQATQQRVANDAPVETTYYVYNSGGQRVRKVNETAQGKKANERIYLGGFEVYREYGASDGAPTLERKTLHIMDDKRRIALVETKTIDQSAAANSLPSASIRYQFDNHLGSACLELDETAAVISYEEYYPYGSTSYQAGRSANEVSLKRYRYIGKERDEENGFYYLGARYYASWIGRWVSGDPSGLLDGVNLYSYARGNPVSLVDSTGTQTDVPSPAEEASQSSSELLHNASYVPPPEELSTVGPSSAEQILGRSSESLHNATYSARPPSPSPDPLISSAKTPAPTTDNIELPNGPILSQWNPTPEQLHDLEVTKPLRDMTAAQLRYPAFKASIQAAYTRDQIVKAVPIVLGPALEAIAPAVGSLPEVVSPLTESSTTAATAGSLEASGSTAATTELTGTGTTANVGSLEAADRTEVTTFFHGTTAYTAEDIVANQAVSVERLAAHQAGKAFTPGLYTTSQEETAQFYGNLLGGTGRGGGPGVVKIEVPTSAFNEFAGTRGIGVETEVPHPPIPGQTETFIPMNHVQDFNSIPGIRFSLVLPW